MSCDMRCKDKEDILPDLFHVDEPQLKVLKAEAVKIVAGNNNNGGASYFSKRDR